jgi:uncharacterized hydrophobic protein (TIGR00271 family)
VRARVGPRKDGRVLHLRVYSPTALTDEVVHSLAGNPTVTEMAVLRGVGIEPAPDLVMAEVVRESVNEVIDVLRRLGVNEQGAIQVEPVPVWISRRGLDAEDVAPGASPDAVVWAEVVQRAYEDSALTWTYASFLTMATMIAAIGIVLDSQILLIGAMVLGPEFGAIAALGLALVRRRRALLGQAVRTLILGFLVAIAITTVVAGVARALGWMTPEAVFGPRPLTAFIYEPDKWSFIVALIAGAAGVLALTSAKSGGITGVFISVTTVPAAGNVALCLAFGNADGVLGSSVQLLINISGMAFSGWLTLVVQQTVWRRIQARQTAAP